MLHQIGSGVLGPVFRTFDPTHDRLIAVKAFRLDLVPEKVAQLADGLRRLVATKIGSQVPVALIDAGLEGTTAYLASEYVAAETLDVVLRHLAPAPLDRAAPIIARLADALDTAAAAGILHGALHPRDVFVTADADDVRITGLGIAQTLDAVGAKSPIRRPYTAPERANGDRWDQRADVYSLGAIAHELLTRRRPAGSGEQDGVLPAASAEQRVQIRRVLATVLAEHPEHRFQTARAFADALTAIVQGGLAQGHEVQPVQEVRPVQEVQQVPLVATVQEGSTVQTVDSVQTTDSVQTVDAIDTAETVLTPAPVEPDDALVSDARQPAEPLVDEPVRDDAIVDEVAPELPVIVATTGAPIELPVRHEPEAPSDPDAAIDLLRVAESAPQRPSASDTADAFASDVWHPADAVPMHDPDVPEHAPRSRVSWPAIAAVILAGAALGAVLEYRHTQSTDTPPASSSIAAMQPARNETEVPVASDATAPAATAPATSPRAGAAPVAKTPPASPTPSSAAAAKPSTAVAAPSVRPSPRPKPAPPVAAERLPARRADKPAVVRDAAPRAGQVVVRSTPPGALVMLDGRPRGQTPATLNDLAFGPHTIEVARSGFVPHAETVTLSGNAPVRLLSVDLQPGLSTVVTTRRGTPVRESTVRADGGSMFVDSRPQKARVIVDGRYVGTTPLRLPELQLGPHAVRLEMSGYRPFATTVGVRAGEQARVTAALEERDN